MGAGGCIEEAVDDNTTSGMSNLSREELRELVGRSEIVSPEFAAASPHFSRAVAFHALWQARGAALPLASDFRLGVIDPEFLPNCSLCDVMSGGDYSFRFYGSTHVAHFGADLTGLTCSQIEAANPRAKIIRQLYDAVLHKRDAVFFALNYLNDSDVVKRAAGVSLPLAGDDGAVTELLTFMDWYKD